MAESLVPNFLNTGSPPTSLESMVAVAIFATVISLAYFLKPSGSKAKRMIRPLPCTIEREHVFRSISHPVHIQEDLLQLLHSDLKDLI